MGRETRDIEISRNLALHHIYSQAGSVEKALSEAIMNALDSNSTVIRIDIAEDGIHYTIADNGRGFKDEHEIINCFGRLGFNHQTEEEKAKARTFGRFGLGRAQLWCWSRNTWQSGPYRMHVDIEANGLSYELERNAEPVPGCTLVGEFYTPLKITELAELRRNLKDLTQYMDITIVFNGDVISKPVSDMKWDKVTDDGFFKFAKYGGLKIYNQGMYVCTHAPSKYGISGTVVSRTNLELNVARNEVMLNRCEVFPRIVETLKEKAKTLQSKSNQSLSDADRMTMLAQAANGEYDYYDLKGRPLFKGVNGRHYSLNQLYKKFDGHIAVADKNNTTAGERLIETGRALVMSPDFFNFTDYAPEDFVASLNATLPHYYEEQVKLLEYEPLAEEMRSTPTPDDERKLPKTQKVALKSLRKLCLLAYKVAGNTYSHGEFMARMHGEETEASPYSVGERRLYSGKMDGAIAWTDGASIIGITMADSQRMLNRGLKGFMEVLSILLHEYAHLDSSMADHSHDIEFYKRYHDMSMNAHTVYYDLKQALRSHAKELIKQGLAVPHQIARDISKDEAGSIENDLAKRDLLAE